MDKQQTTKDRFWAKFVEPADSNLRAMTLNNVKLLVRGTADEIVAFIEGEKGIQRTRIVKELERWEKDFHFKDISISTAIKIIEKYKGQ